jgi:formate transporter
LLKGESEVVDAAGLSSSALENLTVPDLIVGQLIPVTAGNIVGGAFLVGVVYWAVYLRPK